MAKQLGDAQFADMPTYHIVSLIYIYIHHHTPVYPHYITIRNPLWLVLEPIEVGYSKSHRSHHTLQHNIFHLNTTSCVYIYIVTKYHYTLLYAYILQHENNVPTNGSQACGILPDVCG